MTVERAREEAARVIGEFASGQNRAEIKRAIRQHPTFGDVFDDLIEHKRNKHGKPLSDRTKAEYRAAMRLHLAPFKARKMSEISHEQVAALHSKVGKTAPIQANRVKALVSSVYGHALKRRLYVGENPAAAITGFAENRRDRFIQRDEFPALFDSLAQDPQRDFFLLALLTGARRSNVLSMRWSDLDLTDGIWRVEMTKNAMPQNVTLSPEAVAVLAARRQAAKKGAEFVFPGVGKSGHMVEPKTAWARIVRRAGLRGLRIHDLRRTLGSWQAKTGASLVVIGKSLNHLSSKTTEIYARLDLDPVRQSVNTATVAMMEAAGVKEAAKVVPIKKTRA